jgi:uncharacterized protein (DUF433 family)
MPRTPSVRSAGVNPVREMPPRGHYFANEVGRLAGVSGKTIGQWRHYDYIRASQSSNEYPLVYAFQDIGEAMIVHELIHRGVTLPEVKNAIEYVRERYPYDWPLQHSDLRVTPGTVAHPHADAEMIDVGHRVVGQGFLMEPEDLEQIREILSRGGWAVRDLPKLEHIEVDPDRLSGRPTIRGRRVPAEDVARTAVTEDGLETLREGYDLSDDEINDAVQWWERVQEYEAA